MASSESETTQWTLIRRAQGEGPQARAAIGQLILRYQPSITGLIRHCRHPPDQTAEEIRQEFLARVLQRGDLLTLDPLKGKFRSWLAVAVRRHVSNAWDAWWARKNPERWLERPETLEIGGRETPEQLLLRRFALDTLCHAEKQLRESARERERFEALRRFLPGPDMALEDAKLVAEHLGLTAGALRKAIHDLRREFERVLRRTVADTLDIDPEDPGAQAAIDCELRELYASLSFAPEAIVV